MDAASAHIPKQAAALIIGPEKVTTYETTGGIATAQFAAHNLTLLPQPIPSNIVVHDNACGSGTFSRALLATHPEPSTLKIYATDNDQTFLDHLSQTVKKDNLPITVSNKTSEDTGFADEFFDLSLTNLGIFFTSSAGVDGAKEIYRTLKPGGTAVLNCWKNVAWFLPIKSVHDKYRPGKSFPAPTINWTDGVQIKKVVLEAGFKEENVRLEQSEGWVRVKEGEEFRKCVERTWAYLGGVGGWEDGDEVSWGEEVELLESLLLAMEGKGVKRVDGEVWLGASQWVVVAKK